MKTCFLEDFVSKVDWSHCFNDGHSLAFESFLQELGTDAEFLKPGVNDESRDVANFPVEYSQPADCGALFREEVVCHFVSAAEVWQRHRVNDDGDGIRESPFRFGGADRLEDVVDWSEWFGSVVVVGEQLVVVSAGSNDF